MKHKSTAPQTQGKPEDQVTEAASRKAKTRKNTSGAPQTTELVFILDRSGSMSGLESDTIGGFNSFLKKQKQLEGKCRITTVLFDSSVDILHDRLDIETVKMLTHNDYQVRGCTALLDAIGTSIKKISKVQKSSGNKHKANNVIFVIITDGEENASKKYTLIDINKLLTKMKKLGWEFIFLGANIDAIETASHFGIAADRAQNFRADSDGVSANFDAINDTVECMRQFAAVPQNWNEKISADYAQKDK